MAMNTPAIIFQAERLYTLTKRAAVSDDRDARRAEIVERFQRLATILGKIATKFREPEWMNVHERVVFLHTEAVQADERRQATFVHAGSEMALLTALHALAAALGFVLHDVDADTGSADAEADEAHDDAAMASVEHREAAE
jgi:hypothetical protein